MDFIELQARFIKKNENAHLGIDTEDEVSFFPLYLNVETIESFYPIADGVWIRTKSGDDFFVLISIEDLRDKFKK